MSLSMTTFTNLHMFCFSIYLQIRLSDFVHLARSIVGGKSLTTPHGTWWPMEATRRLAVLFVTTLALLFARLQIMGSQLPVFTR